MMPKDDGRLQGRTSDDKRVHFTLRMSRLVDQKLAEASSEMGVSKNAYILMILSEKLAEKPQKAN